MARLRVDEMGKGTAGKLADLLVGKMVEKWDWNLAYPKAMLKVVTWVCLLGEMLVCLMGDLLVVKLDMLCKNSTYV